MEVRRQAARNALGALVDFATSFGVRFAIQILVTRQFTKPEIGSWNVLNAIVAYVVLIAGVGYHGSMLRDTLRRPDRASYWWLHATVVRLVLTSILDVVSLVFIWASWRLGYLELSARDAWVLVLLYAGALALACKPSPVLDAFQRLTVLYKAQVYTSTLSLIFLLIFIKLFKLRSIVTLVAIQQFFGALQIFVMIYYMHTRIRPIRWKFSVRRAIHGAWKSLPKGIEAIFSQSAQLLDRIFIGFIIGYAAAADYWVAVGFCSIASILQQRLYRVCRPILLEGAVQNDHALLIRRTATYLRAYSAVSLPLVVGTAFVGMTFIPRVYGEQYFTAVIANGILAMCSFTDLYYQTFIDILFAFHDDRRMVKASWIAFVVNVVLNLVLIPILGIAGAAIATVGSFAVGAVCASLMLRRHVHLAVTPYILRPLIACVPLALAVYATIDLPWPVQIVAGSLVYGLALLPLRHFSRDEYALVLRGPLAPLARLIPAACCRTAAR